MTQRTMPLAQASRQQQPEPQHEQDLLSEEENLDVRIATGLGLKFMDTPEGQEALQGAVSGEGDMIAKLGVLFSGLMDKIQNKMEETPTPISPRVWLSQGGVLDQWLNELMEDGVIPEGIAPELKEEVVNVLKLQKQSVGGNQQQPPGLPPQQQPMPPQQQAMMGGM